MLRGQGEPRTMWTLENYKHVMQAMVEDRTCSCKQTALELDLTRRSLHHVIKE